MPRIVSLLPSATEWVFALGLDGDLLGVTFECDAPGDPRRDRAVVVEGLRTTRDDGSPLPPGEIDGLVRATLAAGRPLYRLDEAGMAGLAPDVVLTQDLCAVCALPAAQAREAVRRAGCPGTVVTLDPHTLEEVLDGATAVADACGHPERGRRLRDELGARLRQVATAVGTALPAATGADRPRPRVLVLEWTDPPFVAGHWVPDLVVAAGAEPVLARPGDRSVPTTWAQVAETAAASQGLDGVLVAPCGFGLDAAAEQARALLERLPEHVAVWAVDAGAVVTRPGPRVVDGVEALAALWHPAAVPARPGLAVTVRPPVRAGNALAGGGAPRR